MLVPHPRDELVRLEPFLVELRQVAESWPNAGVMVVLDPEGTDGEVLSARPLAGVQVDRESGEVTFLTDSLPGAGAAPSGVVLAELLHQLEAEALPTDVASWTGGAGAVRLTAPLVGVGIDEENQRVALVRERLPDRPPGMDEWGHASQISSSARSLLAPPRNPDAGRPDRH